jgi:hypothetical protein
VTGWHLAPAPFCRRLPDPPRAAHGSRSGSGRPTHAGTVWPRDLYRTCPRPHLARAARVLEQAARKPIPARRWPGMALRQRPELHPRGQGGILAGCSSPAGASGADGRPSCPSGAQDDSLSRDSATIAYASASALVTAVRAVADRPGERCGRRAAGPLHRRRPKCQPSTKRCGHEARLTMAVPRRSRFTARAELSAQTTPLIGGSRAKSRILMGASPLGLALTDHESSNRLSSPLTDSKLTSRPVERRSLYHVSGTAAAAPAVATIGVCTARILYVFLSVLSSRRTKWYAPALGI